MRVLNVLAASAAFICLGAAAGHAVEVREVAEIKASPSAVWAKIGEWCAIKDWHPAIAACDASRKGFRTLTLKDGGKIVEKLIKTGPNSYSYDIIESPLPVKNYAATLAAKADSLGSTDLTWTAKFDAKGKPDSEAAAVIQGIFAKGLKNIKDTMKFDATAPAAAAGKTVAAAGAATAGATAAAAMTDKEAARAKAREERRIKLEKVKLSFMEKAVAVKAAIADKAKVAADSAKAAYEKAKTAVMDAVKKVEEKMAPKAPATGAAPAPAATAAEKEAAAAKVREERRVKIEKARLAVIEKTATIKAAIAEKAKAAADVAKSAYEKAKTAIMDATKKMEEAPKKP